MDPTAEVYTPRQAVRLNPTASEFISPSPAVIGQRSPTLDPGAAEFSPPGVGPRPQHRSTKSDMEQSASTSVIYQASVATSDASKQQFGKPSGRNEEAKAMATSPATSTSSNFQWTSPLTPAERARAVKAWNECSPLIRSRKPGPQIPTVPPESPSAGRERDKKHDDTAGHRRAEPIASSAGKTLDSKYPEDVKGKKPVRNSPGLETSQWKAAGHSSGGSYEKPPSSPTTKRTSDDRKSSESDRHEKTKTPPEDKKSTSHSQDTGKNQQVVVSVRLKDEPETKSADENMSPAKKDKGKQPERSSIADDRGTTNLKEMTDDEADKRFQELPEGERMSLLVDALGTKKRATLGESRWATEPATPGAPSSARSGQHKRDTQPRIDTKVLDSPSFERGPSSQALPATGPARMARSRPGRARGTSRGLSSPGLADSLWASSPSGATGPSAGRASTPASVTRSTDPGTPSGLGQSIWASPVLSAVEDEPRPQPTSRGRGNSQPGRIQKTAKQDRGMRG